MPESSAREEWFLQAKRAVIEIIDVARSEPYVEVYVQENYLSMLRQLHIAGDNVFEDCMKSLYDIYGPYTVALIGKQSPGDVLFQCTPTNVTGAQTGFPPDPYFILWADGNDCAAFLQSYCGGSQINGLETELWRKWKTAWGFFAGLRMIMFKVKKSRVRILQG